MSDTIVNLTKDDFQSSVSQGTVIVDFWASWCPPCRAFAPTFEAAAQTHTTMQFAKVDTDDQQELAAALNITSIPTLMAFRDGILVFAQPGALSTAQLEAVLKAVEDLDMDQVRAELDQAK